MTTLQVQLSGGTAGSLVTEVATNIPTTAHILGGCCMGADSSEGVIDHRHQVFGYPGLYVIDGSAISNNPGVNPSLTILALAEPEGHQATLPGQRGFPSWLRGATDRHGREVPVGGARLAPRAETRGPRGSRGGAVEAVALVEVRRRHKK